MPDLPSSMPPQLCSLPIPTGVTRPTPVITARRFDMNLWPSSIELRARPVPVADARAGGGLLGARLDVVDGVAHGLDLLRVLVRDLDLEGLFERQDQLDDGQRVGLQVLGEGSARDHLFRRYLELLDDDLGDAFFDAVRHVWIPLFFVLVCSLAR